MRMSFARRALMGMALAVGAAGFATGATAQTAPAPAASGPDNAWLKICNTDPEANKELCLITQELRTDSGQFLASIAIRETPGEARKALLVSVPVGMVIKPGVQLQIDGGTATPVEYGICFPNACYAEATIDAAFITRLKAGGKLQLTTYNQQGRAVRFDMTLIGFTSAYDGPGLNPQEIEAKRSELQSQLEQKAEEARARLVAEQRKVVEEAAQ